MGTNAPSKPCTVIVRNMPQTPVTPHLKGTSAGLRATSEEAIVSVPSRACWRANTLQRRPLAGAKHGTRSAVGRLHKIGMKTEQAWRSGICSWKSVRPFRRSSDETDEARPLDIEDGDSQS